MHAVDRAEGAGARHVGGDGGAGGADVIGQIGELQCDGAGGTEPLGVDGGDAAVFLAADLDGGFLLGLVGGAAGGVDVAAEHAVDRHAGFLGQQGGDPGFLAVGFAVSVTAAASVAYEVDLAFVHLHGGCYVGDVAGDLLGTTPCPQFVAHPFGGGFAGFGGVV